MLHSPKNWAAAPSSYCFINMARIELEIVRLSDIWNLSVFVNTLTVDDQYSFRNRKNLPETIKLQLSEKQKLFLIFLLHIWNLH